MALGGSYGLGGRTGLEGVTPQVLNQPGEAGSVGVFACRLPVHLPLLPRVH